MFESSQPHPCRLRILSYNIHQGITVRRNRLGLAALKEAIASERPDVVVLQEVAGLLPSPEDASPGPLASCYQLEELGVGWPYTIWGKNADFSSHCHGNAVLSRFPIASWHNEDITVGPFERRGLLHATLRVPFANELVHVMGVHLGLCRRERYEQARRLCLYIGQQTRREETLFLVGDFNDWLRRLSGLFSDRLGVREVRKPRGSMLGPSPRTYPARFPVLHLDRIYYRGARLTSYRRPKGKPWHLLSDHLPLIAEFEYPTVT